MYVYGYGWKKQNFYKKRNDITKKTMKIFHSNKIEVDRKL